MKNPVATCRKIIEYIHELTELIRERAEVGGTGRKTKRIEILTNVSI